VFVGPGLHIECRDFHFDGGGGVGRVRVKWISWNEMVSNGTEWCPRTVLSLISTWVLLHNVSRYLAFVLSTSICLRLESPHIFQYRLGFTPNLNWELRKRKFQRKYSGEIGKK